MGETLEKIVGKTVIRHIKVRESDEEQEYLIFNDGSVLYVGTENVEVGWEPYWRLTSIEEMRKELPELQQKSYERLYAEAYRQVLEFWDSQFISR